MAEKFKVAIRGKGSIAGMVTGAGPRLLVCFHGYGQSRRLYASLFPEAPAGWRVAMIDLVFFGESEWIDENEPVLPEDLDVFLKGLLEQFPSEEVHFLAFSLGAKVALGLYEATDQKVKSVTLVSPDGLRIHPLYRFCIYNPVGKALFYTVLRWPGLFLGVLRLLYKLRITDPFKYTFVSRQFDTAGKRALLRRVWRGYARIRPSIEEIAARSAATATVWHVIWGAKDDVLPVNLCKDFIENVNGAKLHVVQGGHFLLHQPQEEVNSLLKAILKT